MNLANNKIVRQATKHGGELVRYLSKNSPTILTGCALAGTVTAVVLAVKATKPALQHIREEKKSHRDRIIIIDGDEREDNELTDEEIDAIVLKPTEVVKATWKDYIPTAIVLGGTAACIIGAHSISAKRTAAMAALYTASETALKDWKSKTEEIAGKSKKNQIKDAVNEVYLDRVAVDGFINDGMFIETGHGSVKFIDSITGRCFKSDYNFLVQCANSLNQSMIGGDWRTSLNEWYQEIGLDPVSVIGEDLGWTVDSMIELEPTSKLMSNGESVTVIGFKYQPDMGYRDT